MNFLILTSIYVVVGGGAISIFLWGKPDGNSLFDRAYRVVCQHIPRLLKDALCKVFGPRAPEALDKAWTYVCYTSNPIVQVFYLCVVVGGYLTFVTYGYAHIPNRMLGHYHRYIGFGLFCSCLTCWWRACSLDPGSVTQENVEGLLEVYEYDNQIFEDGFCRTCELKKPARSKHCSLCNICVAKFDHHCIWINNCVGVGNHRYFLGFLFVHCVICSYGCGLGLTIVYQQIKEKELFAAVFIDPVTRDKHPATYMIVFQYMLAKEGMVIFVTILCAVMGLVLFGFFLWHLNLVRTGVTTNEMSKWNYLKWMLKQEGEEGKEQIKGLRNQYNDGCFSNFKAVFFPHNIHSPPIAILTEGCETGKENRVPRELKEYKGKKERRGKAKAG